MKKWPTLKKMSSKYILWKRKHILNKKISETVKNSISIMALISSVVFYGYFVNISSTKGFFLRKEMNKLEDIKFENSIEKLEVAKLEKKLLDNLISENFDPSTNVVDSSRILVLDSLPEVALNNKVNINN